MSQNSDLWTHKDSGTQYIIPRGIPLEVGHYELESPDGEEISVVEDVAADVTCVDETNGATDNGRTTTGAASAGEERLKCRARQHSRGRPQARAIRAEERSGASASRKRPS